MQLGLVMAQVLQVLVGLAALLADVGLVVGVGQQVPLVAGVVLEGLAALPALEGPQAGVQAPVGDEAAEVLVCLLYTSPSPRDMYKSRMPSSA